MLCAERLRIFRAAPWKNNISAARRVVEEQQQQLHMYLLWNGSGPSFFFVTQSCYQCLDYYQATSSDSKCVCSVMNSQATFSNKNVPPNQNVLTRQAVVSVLARTAKPAHAHAKRQRVFWIIEHIFYTGCSALPSQFSQLSHSFGSWCHAGRFRRGQAGVVCLRRPP